MIETFGAIRHSSCAKIATSRSAASGTRTGCATAGGPRGTGAGNTMARGASGPPGNTGASATCPTIDVVVVVTRRSRLRSR